MAKYLDAAGVTTLWGQIKAKFRTEEQVQSVVDAAVAGLVDSAPETLNTLRELAENFDGMATQSWVEGKGYLTEHQDISGKVDKEIAGSNGTAQIFNESDGGGAHFIHNDGSEAFVGVNDGGENGMMAQIYADKQIDGSWVGSRVNVYHDGIYYVSKENQLDGKAKNAAECEIAVKGDLTNKLNILPNVEDENDPGYGYPYWIPYNFEFTPEASDVKLTLHTLTLDNNFLKMDFEKSIPVATDSVSGFMSAADKAKLDGIAAGADDIEAMTNEEILAICV